MAETDGQQTEHFDVLIVRAGILGVGSAYHPQTQCPDKSYAVLEALESFGGTWWMHRYPGIRSDSDLYTFGYRFKPWTGTPIATADEILKYMGEVIEDNGIDEHIRYQHHIDSASWSSDTQTWRLAGRCSDTGAPFAFTCNLLWMCQGYYEHARGYTPEWDGMDSFRGQIVHPQTWPENLDYRGKRVLVIGSGATTATVVPAIASDCEHVTVLQRSPTYFIPGRNENPLASQLRELQIDESWIHGSFAGRSSTSRLNSPADVSKSRKPPRMNCWQGSATTCLTTTTSRRTSPRATGPGARASRSCRMGTFSKASRPARRTS